jgi:hypothetical protein
MKWPRYGSAEGGRPEQAAERRETMRRLGPFLTFALTATLVAACTHSRVSSAASPQEKTVLKVENRGFPDMNVYAVPQGGGRVRLGTVVGNSNAYFTLPEYLLRGIRELSFQALPIATPRGPVSQSIIVSPGDTIVLVIPPS